MFKKPLKIKSNNQLKASERKTFKDLVLKSFPNLTEDQVNEFLPKKEVLHIVKLLTHDDITVIVYTVQKKPMLFETGGSLLPTVYFLWRFPNVIYAFTIHHNVMQYISSGADLMLPGVVPPPPQSGLPKYGNVSERDIVYINLTSNIAAVAVGTANQSSGSMSLANGRGRCVVVQHFYGDNLCTLDGSSLLPLTNLGPPEWLKFKSYEEDFPELGSNSKKPLNVGTTSEETNEESVVIKEPETLKIESCLDTVEDMDSILTYCFLGAIKYSKVTLPVLTSNFFKLHMLPLCSEKQTLDIKKTSFKKLKPFLEKMAEEGIITVKEVKKGVEQITGINQNHPKYKEFYISSEKRPKKEEEAASAPKTDIVESYVITQNVLPLFREEGYNGDSIVIAEPKFKKSYVALRRVDKTLKMKFYSDRVAYKLKPSFVFERKIDVKGDTIQGPNVRKYVTKYIKEHNLQDENNSSLVKPRDVLATVCKTELPIHWEEVIEKVCESMRNCYKVRTATEEIINKGKVSPITISVSVRSGNKKVTLVDNLELFGIRLPDFAKECQHGVAASTSISRPPGKKSDQLLVQGNQVNFVYDLLTEKYKIPKKYIQGLENAPKKKK